MRKEKSWTTKSTGAHHSLDIHRVSVCSFLSITAHLSSPSDEEDYEVSPVHSGVWIVVLLSSTLSLCGYSDANFAGCRLDCKSTSGTYQFIGSSLVFSQ